MSIVITIVVGITGVVSGAFAGIKICELLVGQTVIKPRNDP